MNRGSRQKLTPIQAWQRTPRDGSVRVTEIRTVRDDPGCVWIVLDGVRAGLVDRETAAKAGLALDQPAWTESLAARLDAEVRRRLCDRGAVRLLASRMRSRSGLIEALVRRGHDAETAGVCADAYAERGAIDDARFAEVVVRNELARKPAGRRFLEAKLYAKGVRGEHAGRAIEEALGQRSELEDARKVAASAARSIRDGTEPDAFRRRLSGRLARRGFSGGVIRRVVDELLRERRS